VRLRLAQSRDLQAVAELLRDAGHAERELELASLLRCHPRDRVVICATALIGRGERVVGFGSIRAGEREPELLCADGALGEELEGLLRDALAARAAAIASRRAA
jgi:hypothetical protein